MIIFYHIEHTFLKNDSSIINFNLKKFTNVLFLLEILVSAQSTKVVWFHHQPMCYSTNECKDKLNIFITNQK